MSDIKNLVQNMILEKSYNGELDTNTAFKLLEFVDTFPEKKLVKTVKEVLNELTVGGAIVGAGLVGGAYALGKRRQRNQTQQRFVQNQMMNRTRREDIEEDLELEDLELESMLDVNYERIN